MELDLSQGFPVNLSILNTKQIKQIIDWEMSMFQDKEPSIDFIYDKICVGNYAAALDKDILEKFNISHIIIAGKDMIDLYRDKFTYKILPLYDSPYLKLRKYFKDVNLFINDFQSKFKEEGNDKIHNLLIHCGSGISRSVSFAVAYFIEEKGMTYEEAMRLVKSKRKISNPNNGFEKELRDYSYEIHKKF